MNIVSSVVIVVALLVLTGCSTGEECSQLVVEKCSSCHSIKKTCSQDGKDKKYWEATVDQMIRLMAPISEKEKRDLVKCLSKSSKRLNTLCE